MAEEEANVILFLPGAAPGRYGIGMKHEMLGGFADGPISQAHDLQNLKTVKGGVVWPSVFRDLPPVEAQYGYLAPQELCVKDCLVTLGHHAFVA
ncbi:MAG: hypothetical protein IIB04_04010 [Acidobacteria bacterium]|nr:hypothetical protein [Acidobacteriota bacterium]